MYILAFAGSPRVGGNTDVLTDQVLAGAAAAGARVEKVRLAEYNIHPIRDCRVCQAEGGGGCAVKDDAFHLMDLLNEPDLIIFATPLYWYGMSAQLKAWMDRWSCFLDPTIDKMHGAKLALIHPRGEAASRVADALRDGFRLIATYCGMEWVGDFDAICDRRGEVAEQPDTMARAFAWGKQLAQMPPGRNKELPRRRWLPDFEGLEGLGKWTPS